MVPGRQRVGQRLLVDDAAAGDVEHARRFFISASSRAPIRLLRLVRQRNVDGEEVDLRQQFVERRRDLDAELRGLRGRDERVEAMTFMSRPVARRATSRPMRPRPMTPSVLPASCVPTNLLRSQPPALMHGVGRRHVAGQGEQERDGVLGGARRVLPPGVFMTTMPLRVAAGHVDVVDADAGPDDRPELAGVLEALGGDLGAASGRCTRRTREARRRVRRPSGRGGFRPRSRRRGGVRPRRIRACRRSARAALRSRFLKRLFDISISSILRACPETSAARGRTPPARLNDPVTDPGLTCGRACASASLGTKSVYVVFFIFPSYSTDRTTVSLSSGFIHLASAAKREHFPSGSPLRSSLSAGSNSRFSSLSIPARVTRAVTFAFMGIG